MNMTRFVRQGESGPDGFTVVFPPAFDCFTASRYADAGPQLESALRNFIDTVNIVDPGVYGDAIREAELALRGLAQ